MVGVILLSRQKNFIKQTLGARRTRRVFLRNNLLYAYSNDLVVIRQGFQKKTLKTTQQKIEKEKKVLCITRIYIT